MREFSNTQFPKRIHRTKMKITYNLVMFTYTNQKQQSANTFHQTSSDAAKAAHKV